MSGRPSLYPDILFHFTSRSSLFKILEETFAISYAREKIVGKRKTAKFAVPMVSFCDLKLSELKLHMGKYGKYGIGLTKSWANKRGLNPVFYINRHSPFSCEFINAIGGFFDHLNTIDDDNHYNAASRSYMSILNSLRYIKNYEGNLIRNGKTTRNYRYADEREWRYVPALSEACEHFVPLKNIETDEQKAALNQSISHLRLAFQPEDIRYLIIERDDERSDLIRHLEQVKGNRFDEDTIRRLASRILTADQIKNDI